MRTILVVVGHELGQQRSDMALAELQLTAQANSFAERWKVQLVERRSTTC